jgi:hypothetical protein
MPTRQAITRIALHWGVIIDCIANPVALMFASQIDIGNNLGPGSVIRATRL